MNFGAAHFQWAGSLHLALRASVGGMPHNPAASCSELMPFKRLDNFVGSEYNNNIAIKNIIIKLLMGTRQRQ